MSVLSTASKFRFRIRTRQGQIVERVLIQGRSEADAERKLLQMYPHCEILESPSGSSTPIPRMLRLHSEPSILPGK